MEQLWAPWRLAYVEQDSSSKPKVECFICQGLSENSDKTNQIVLRTRHSVVLLNRYPYNNGHLLVAPLLHVSRLDQLSSEGLLEINETIRLLVQTLEKTIKPDGFNIGMNLGKVAGAGLPGHIHWHIVPRWNGDTNFMPIVADVKVIVQSLESLYEVLTAELTTAK